MPRSSIHALVPAMLAFVLLLSAQRGAPEASGLPAGPLLPGARDETVGQIVEGDPIESLAPGRILLATRQVRDSIFEQSVVLLFARSGAGTAGLILNRPTDIPVARVLPDLPGGAAGPHTFFGGPVSIGEFRGLLRSVVSPGDATLLLPGLHLLATPERVEAAVADGVMVGQLRLYYGYAGWGAGQLEREIRRGDWYVLNGDVSVVFDSDPER